MNYLYTVLLVLSWCCLRVSAQPDNIKKLEKKLTEQTKDDQQRMDLLRDLSYEYISVDAQKGLDYARQLLKLAKKLNHQEKLALAYTSKANNLSALGQDSLAVIDYLEGIQIYYDLGDELQAATTTANLGVLYNKTGNYNEALSLFDACLKTFRKHKDSAKILQTLTNTGVTCFYLGDNLKAIDYYYQGIVLAESLGEQLQQANLYMNIGLIQKRLGKYEEAVEAYTKSEQLIDTLQNKQEYGNLLGNMASTYDMMGNTQKAIDLYTKALAVARQTTNRRGEASHLTNLGVVYFGMGDYPKSMACLDQGLTIYEQYADLSAISLIYTYKGQIVVVSSDEELLEMNIAPADRFRQAEQLMQKAVQLAQETGNVHREHGAWYSLAVTHEQQGKYKDAAAAYKKHIELREAILGQEQKEGVEQLKMQYELGKRDAQAAAEIMRHKTARNAIIAGSLVLVIAGLGIFIAYKKRQDALKQQQEMAFKAALSENEMKVLRLQMNPHFIFNSLNSISDYIGKNDIDSADYYLTKFAKLTRGILENSAESTIPLSEELKMLELYMQLEASRLHHKFSYEIKIAEDIVSDDIEIPPLILQPFVENSIWHGISRKEGKGNILIEVTKINTMFQCVVEDDGVGRTDSATLMQHPVKKKSYGIRITKERVDLLNRLQNVNASVHMVDLKKGTRVEIRLPLILES